MNTEIKRKLEQMFLKIVEHPVGDCHKFAGDLGGKFLGCPSTTTAWEKDRKKAHKIQYGKARRGYEKIIAKPHYDFPPYVIEIPIKRAERMIILGWEP
jgi:hypothetical protein